jgi:hypothetical protein
VKTWPAVNNGAPAVENVIIFAVAADGARLH